MPYIGTSPSNGVRRVFDYTATAGQTSFSGSDNNSQTLAYTDSTYIDVYQNGILLIPSDYTATTGTTVVLDTGATVSDTVQIVVYDVFSVADTVSASDGGSFGGNLGVGGTLSVTGVPTFTGRSVHSGGVTVANDGQIGSVGDADAMAISSAGVVNFTQTPTYASTKDPFNSVIETWYYDSTDRTHTNGADLSQTWTRKTNNLTANKNGGMSNSSGIWTFPSTGVWSIAIKFEFYSSAATTYHGCMLEVTSDNSTYNEVINANTSTNASSVHSTIYMPYILNITDTTNQKFKWSVLAQHQIVVRGGTGTNVTLAQFIKLCPSV